jgi:hypothetical protein
LGDGAHPGFKNPIHFALVIVEMGSLELFAILLISASQAARIAGMSHRRPDVCDVFNAVSAHYRKLRTFRKM